MIPAWPVAGTAARLRAADGSWVPCRVASADAGAVVLAVRERVLLPPSFTGTLEWGSDLGLVEAPVAGASREPGGLRWVVAPCGVPSLQQRRRFVRVPIDVELLLQFGRTRFTGRALDLSEGGVRCLVPTQARIAHHPRVCAALPLPDRSLRVEGRVVRIGTHPRGDEVGIAFLDLDEPRAQHLRRHVVDAQIRATAVLRR